MDLKPLRTLLILLVLVASFDDTWAITTPTLSDDLAAAENNDFLPVLRWQQTQKADAKGLPVPAQAAHQAAVLGGKAALPAKAREPRPKLPVGTSLLYTLMSLQR